MSVTLTEEERERERERGERERALGQIQGALLKLQEIRGPRHLKLRFAPDGCTVDGTSEAGSSSSSLSCDGGGGCEWVGGWVVVMVLASQ